MNVLQHTSQDWESSSERPPQSRSRREHHGKNLNKQTVQFDMFRQSRKYSGVQLSSKLGTHQSTIFVAGKSIGRIQEAGFSFFCVMLR
jgi:hypothetical protein